MDFLENSVSERKEEVKRRRREREDLHRSRAARPIKASNADVAKLVSASQSSPELLHCCAVFEAGG